MRLRLANLACALDAPDLRPAVAARLGLPVDTVREVRILRRALDARQHRHVHFICQVVADVADDARLADSAGAEPYNEPAADTPLPPARLADAAPVVVGAGPAGLFAALALAEAGLPPLLVERGRPVPERAGDVKRFWDAGELDPESNMYFGEGGAGTFSDGKLNTRSADPHVGRILREFVAAGAPAEILYDSHPHLGTDRLLLLLPRLRERLTSLGVRFGFGTRLTGVRSPHPGRLEACLDGTWTAARPLVLACGHSALDTYRLVAAAGAPLGTKGNAFGCRLEHPAAFITRRFFGPDPAVHRRLGHAHYNLAVPAGGGSVYSFCCCPGGEVVTCAALPGRVSVNGMSFSRRDGAFTNAGLVAAMEPTAFADSAEAALAWRDALEAACYDLGGGAFAIPGQTAADFVAGRPSRTLPATSSRRPVVPADLGMLLPPPLAERLREGLRLMDRKVPGWIAHGALLGVETTTSAPVRILRTAQGESPGLPGLLPVGEGSGYAGGILTSAVDGYRTVAAWLAAQPK